MEHREAASPRVPTSPSEPSAHTALSTESSGKSSPRREDVVPNKQQPDEVERGEPGTLKDAGARVAPSTGRHQGEAVRAQPTSPLSSQSCSPETRDGLTGLAKTKAMRARKRAELEATLAARRAARVSAGTTPLPSAADPKSTSLAATEALSATPGTKRQRASSVETSPSGDQKRMRASSEGPLKDCASSRASPFGSPVLALDTQDTELAQPAIKTTESRGQSDSGEAKVLDTASSLINEPSDRSAEQRGS